MRAISRPAVLGAALIAGCVGSIRDGGYAPGEPLGDAAARDSGPWAPEASVADASTDRAITNDAAEPDACGDSCAPPPQQRRVVGYYGLWQQSVYDPRNIDFSIITHVIESAIYPNPDGTLNLTPDGAFPVPGLVDAAHQAGAFAILGIGGGKSFGQMAASATHRHAFVGNVMALVQRYGFDGIDLDWEFPANGTDLGSFPHVVGELRAALAAGQTLSIAGPSGNWAAQYYDLAALLPVVDWYAAMTYDYGGPGLTPTADPNAPLYSVRGRSSVDATVAYYLARAVPASKLLIGLPFYAWQYNGASALYGMLTTSAGSKPDYSVIPAMIGNGWDAHRYLAPQAPYLLKSDGSPGVITYDDPVSINAKCSYVVSKGLGGAIIWSLGQDGVGPASAQPLLQAARACR
jgi:chitinase